MGDPVALPDLAAGPINSDIVGKLQIVLAVL